MSILQFVNLHLLWIYLCLGTCLAAEGTAVKGYFTAYWPLDEGKGNVATDISARKTDGKIYLPHWMNIEFNNLLLFSNKHRTKVVAGIETPVREFAMSAWFFTPSTGTQTIIQRKGWRNRILLEEGRLSATFDLKEKGGKLVALNAGEKKFLSAWTHVTATYDGEKAGIYVNGELKDEVLANGTLMPGTNICIGAENSHFYFSGFIRDVLIRNKALTEEEIKFQYAKGRRIQDIEIKCRQVLDDSFALDARIEGKSFFLAEDKLPKIGRDLVVTSNLNSNREFSINLKADIADFYGNVVSVIDKEEAFVLGPGGKKTIKLEIPFPKKLGIYFIKGRLLRKAANSIFPLEVEGSFCVIRKPLLLTRKERLKSPFGIIFGSYWAADGILPSLEMLKYSGIRWGEIYTNFEWPAVERNKGTYDFAEADKMRRHLDKAGLMCAAMLIGKNELYENPLDPDAFGRYCYAASEHFKGKILAWNIWGEPHNNDFGLMYDGKSVPVGKWVQKYLEVAKIAAENIKKADPDALTISGGVDVYSTLEAFLSGGMGNHCDIIGVEPYCWSKACDGLPELDGPPAVTIFDDGKRLRELFRNYNVLREMWTVEVGWLAGKEEIKGGVNGIKADYRRQAALLVREYVISLASGIKKIFFWSWQLLLDDSVSESPGLIDGVLNPRPSYAAYSTMSRILEGVVFEKKLHLKPGLRGYVFNRQTPCKWPFGIFRKREDLLVLWSVKDEDAVTVELPGLNLRKIDIQGNDIEGGSLNISPWPVYLIDTPKNIAKICQFLEREYNSALSGGDLQ